MRTHRNTVVIGAGQAGLAASWWLVNRGVDHVVLAGDTNLQSGPGEVDRPLVLPELVAENWSCFAAVGELLGQRDHRLLLGLQQLQDVVIPCPVAGDRRSRG